MLPLRVCEQLCENGLEAMSRKVALLQDRPLRAQRMMQVVLIFLLSRKEW